MKSPSTILKVVSPKVALSKIGTKLPETTKMPGIWRILNRTTGLYGEKAYSLPYNCPTHNKSGKSDFKWINIFHLIMPSSISKNGGYSTLRAPFWTLVAAYTWLLMLILLMLFRYGTIISTKAILHKDTNQCKGLNICCLLKGLSLFNSSFLSNLFFRFSFQFLFFCILLCFFVHLLLSV